MKRKNMITALALTIAIGIGGTAYAETNLSDFTGRQGNGIGRNVGSKGNFVNGRGNGNVQTESNSIVTEVVKPAEENVVTEVANTNFGAQGAKADLELTKEEMLTYAIQDEFLARGEYETIMSKYGTIRPFSNIIKAEENHIVQLKALFETYNYKLPEDLSKNHVALPATLNESYKAGVTAEIENIAMYDKFLKEDLPEDIKAVFINLRDASVKHLSAFQRNAK